MRRPGGYAVWMRPDGAAIERDTVTCAHCSVIVHVEPGTQVSGAVDYCRMCDRHICAQCGGLGRCTPFERQLEAMERVQRWAP